MKKSRIYNERPPWDALPGETSKAYYAFSLYRGLGPKRSIREVADLLAAEAEARDDPNRDPAIRRPPVMRTAQPAWLADDTRQIRLRRRGSDPSKPPFRPANFRGALKHDASVVIIGY